MLAVVAGALVAVAGAVFSGDPINALIVGALSGTAGFLAAPLSMGINYMLLHRRAARLFGQQRALHGEQVVEWDNVRLLWTGPGFTMDTPWQDYHRWHESRAEFLLFVNEQMPQFIPRRALDGARTNDFRATLVAYGPARG